MSLFFITGKPRGGKTFLATKWVYDILLNKNDLRPIITNLPLKLDVISQFLKDELELDFKPDLSKRIRILTESESGEFWLFSKDSDGIDIEFTQRKLVKMRNWSFSVPDFESRGQVGCWYVIDEIHIFFPASFGAAKDSDDDLRYFLSQHGKMNIDGMMITQHPEQVSKIIRRLAQEYMSVRNLSREPYLGFRLGNMFRYIRSLNSPNSINPAPFDSGFQPMNFKKYGQMFDTTAGVGIVGTFIHEPVKRGRSLFWLLIPAVAFVVFIIWFAFFAPGEVNRSVAKMSRSFEKSVLVSNTAHFFVPKLTNSFSRPVAPLVAYSNAETNLVVTGVAVLFGVATVTLSDGSVYSSDHNEVGLITHDYAVVNGISYKRLSHFSQSDYDSRLELRESAPKITGSLNSASARRQPH